MAAHKATKPEDTYNGDVATGEIYGYMGKTEKILECIHTHAATHNRPPTVREIQTSLGISSPSVVDYHLRKLVEAGAIRRSAHTSRGLELCERLHTYLSDDSLAVPVVGTIAAGVPIEVPDSLPDPATWDDTVRISQSLMPLRNDNLFALRVKGNSMIDALIADGDIVLMKPQETAENGDTVAVWIEPEKTTTLKKFYNEGSRVRLQPANVTMKPIYVDPTGVRVQGRVVGVLRQVG